MTTVAAPALAQPKRSGDCGEVVTIQTHDRTTTRYALARPTAATQGEAIAVVLLPGGGGHLDLAANGCPRALKGNSLVRSIPQFRDLGFVTALVDSPSDYAGEDGLAGFRSSAEHADDLGKVIADVRARANGLVWLIGTSRGTISAANAASRQSGPSAPDGLVLTSALMSGAARGARKPWVTQSVFDLALDKIRVPVLVVGHTADTCLRSPAIMMDKITARTSGVREQVVTVTGGPGAPAGSQASLDACEGRAPHGYIEQEAEVAAGIARFIRGGSY
ncbi:MAG: alpha/beta hydrolase [Candidatus Rokuibacteriota bacterium]